MAKAAACLLLAVAGLACVSPAMAAADPLAAARDAAMAYLASQGESGTYPSGLAPYAVEAAAAVGLDALAWPSPSNPASASILIPGEEAPLLAMVRAAYAIAVAGGDLRDWQGQDLEARILDSFDGQQFGNAALLNDDAFAIPALRASGLPAGDDRLLAAARWLAEQRNDDGGWGYAVGAASGTDTTGMVLAAILPVLPPLEGQALRDGARDFVQTTHAGAGFAERPGGQANCDSTVWALRVLGEDGWAEDWQALLALQNPDGGLSYQSGQPSNGLCTAEAATLLADAAAGRIPSPKLVEGRQTPFIPLGMGLSALACAAHATRFRHD